jgi:hypothetical protein
LKDPSYVGVRQKRDRSQAYDDLIEEFFQATQKLYGRNVLLQVSSPSFFCFAVVTHPISSKISETPMLSAC